MQLTPTLLEQGFDDDGGDEFEGVTDSPGIYKV